MFAAILPVASLLVSTFFMLVAGGLSGYLLPLRAAAEGWTTLTISMMATGYALAFTASCLITPRLVMRVGHVRVFGALTALMSISLLMHALVFEPVAWIVFRSIAGFCVAGGYMVIESWLNEKVTNATRGAVFSIYMVVSMTALMAGQFIVPLGDPLTLTLFMVCAVLYSLALIPTALSGAQSPRPLTQSRFRLGRLFTHSPAAVVGSFLAGAIAGAWSNLGPVYSQNTGLTTVEGAFMLAIAMLGGAIFQIPLGRISDRLDRRHVMAGAGIVGLVLSTIATMWDSHHVLVFFVAVFLLGSVLFPIYSLNVAHANDHAEPDDFVEVSSGLLIIYGGGTMLGPLVAGYVMDRMGPSGLFATLAVFFTAYAGYALYRSRRRPLGAEAERSDFLAIPFARSQTPQFYEIDPRSEAETDEESEAA
ncbi:MFS transporter [Pararhizobium mangrovi]|uniref:MFS transporter n=1 Tax=Pararhizobium mangrovi TaxID=2590452 RepID=A0A506U9T5_9HYPH|nr:MFS transporter [Pararhizobium mangrovi]TPW29861.1 MFS transporter [Pararhizobium mangrovi]